MQRRVDKVLNVNIDIVSMKQAVDRIFDFFCVEGNHIVCTPNAEIIYAAQKDQALFDVLERSDMNVADGAGVILGAKIQKRGIVEKVSGIDLVRNSIKDKRMSGKKVFLFGGAEGVAVRAGEKILEMNPEVCVCGYRNGFFSEKDEKQIVEQINASGADILLVALGAPKQEKWIYKYKVELRVKVSIGVGGTLDVFAGKADMAPEFFRKNGLEWLYRLYKQPKRIGRMMALPKFVFCAMLHK